MNNGILSIPNKEIAITVVYTELDQVPCFDRHMDFGHKFRMNLRTAAEIRVAWRSFCVRNGIKATEGVTAEFVDSYLFEKSMRASKSPYGH